MDYFFLFPSPLELHNDNVVTRNSKTHIRLPGTEGYPQTHLLHSPQCTSVTEQRDCPVIGTSIPRAAEVLHKSNKNMKA